MRHWFTNRSKDASNSEHYAVGHDGIGNVLIQLSDAKGEQVRIALSEINVNHLIKLLEENIFLAKCEKNQNAP